MVTGNQTNDYVVIAGPSRIDPNVYRTATFLLLAATIIALVVIQFCLRRNRRRQKLCQICRRKITTDQNDSKKISMESTSCPSSNKSRIFRKFTDPVKSEITDRAASYEDAHPTFHSIDVDCSNEKETNLQQSDGLEINSPNHIEMSSKEIEITTNEDKCLDCAVAAAASRNHESSTIEKHRRDRNTTDSPTDIKESDSAARKKRRSGVCLSMPCGQPLPTTTKNFAHQTDEKSSSRKTDQDINMSAGPSRHDLALALPQLQINGENCQEDDNDSKYNVIPSKISEDDDTIDDGQLQCIVRYDAKNCMLIVKSIYVRTLLDPGVPGFLIEVAVLPKQIKSVKSKIYLSAQRDIDLVIKESFQLQCNDEDFNANSLFIAVKPMFSDAVLYAETELQCLSLSDGNEILLGGNLKNLPTDYS